MATPAPPPTASTSTGTDRVTPVYISAAANRSSNVADVRTSDGLAAFGSGRFVALWDSADVNSRGIKATLPGHKGAVTTVKFLRSDDDDAANATLLASGDSVGGVRIWKESAGTWSMYALLEGHTSSISSLASLRLEHEKWLLVTGSSSAEVFVWVVGTQGAELVQKLDLKGKITLELALTYLPESKSIALAIGSTENKIQVFSSPPTTTPQFAKSLSLEGHTDWVRSLAFITPNPSSTTTSSVGYDISPGELLLASGSQDNYIRLWRFSRLSSSSTPTTSTTPATPLDPIEELERSLAESSTTTDGEIRLKAHDFAVPSHGSFSCSAEAVLLGHDSWITGLHWAPLSPQTPTLRLLSASADRSMILWTPSVPLPSQPSIWTSTRRFGEFSSQTNLGFFGALWGRNGRSVLAHGWGGSWHVWKEEGEGGEWEAVVPVGGHFEAVKSVTWEPEGEFLLSAGGDMTTRLHGVWRRTDSPGNPLNTWHELARPQIHGYQLASIAFTNRLQFISGADEKIVRVFDAPKVFLEGLRTLSGVDNVGDEASRPMAANVPPLGLSNRAIASSAEAEQLAPASNDPFDAVAAVDFTVTSHPPFEEQLLGSTLWPETEKVYGHGYEIIAVAAAHSAPLIATACKSTSAEHAVIRIYETDEWKPVGKVLAGHSLTITSIRFSHDDRFVVSVSRDRSWRLFERAEGSDTYEPVATSTSHARIIWDAVWATDDSFFATASRDKTVKIWTKPETTWTCAATLKFEEAATALACTSLSDPPRQLLAVGLESGEIRFLTSPASEPSKWSSFGKIDSSIGHVLTVTSLAWCPKVEPGLKRLATASEDQSVRIFEISTA
ncbi:RNA polymerase II elongator complex protein 2 [Pseudohyphozyma bogoriensis]|nr:RNA polymerase II elongator complex protein 2 [Pseudohyphozyma bogoriensis]